MKITITDILLIILVIVSSTMCKSFFEWQGHLCFVIGFLVGVIGYYFAAKNS